MNKRQQVLFDSQDICYYCGCKLVSHTKYDDDSACVNLYLPRKFGGRSTLSNTVASCYACCTKIKRDFDVREQTLDAVRAYVNAGRRSLGLSYNAEYVKSLPTLSPQALAEASKPSSFTTIPNEDDDKAEEARLQMIAARLKARM